MSTTDSTIELLRLGLAEVIRADQLLRAFQQACGVLKANNLLDQLPDHAKKMYGNLNRD